MPPPAGTTICAAAVADLLRSGLLAQDIFAEDIPNTFAGFPTEYKIPYFLPDGTPHPAMWRARRLQAAKGAGKYTQPSTSDIVKLTGNHYDASYPYINPLMFHADPHAKTWAEYGARKGKLITIVEGEKKAVALFKATGRQCIGIGGCWNALAHPPEHDKTKNPMAFILHPVIRDMIQDGDSVEVVFDADIQTNEKVECAAGTLRRVLRGLGVSVSFVQTPSSGVGRAGIDDWLCSMPTAAQAAAYADLPRLDGKGFLEDHRTLWKAMGLHMEGKTPIQNEFNVAKMLMEHEEYAGRFKFDVQSSTLTMDEPDGTRRALDLDADHDVVARWLQERAGLKKWTGAGVQRSLSALPGSKIARYNSVIDEWGAPPWDGVPRLEEMFLKAFKAELDDDAYIRMVGRNWLTSAMARLYRPGCQVDTMMILEGEQGIGKSSALKILGGRGHVTMHGDFKSKDFMLAAHRGWLADFDELSGMRFGEVEDLKRIITTRVDTFRSPYGKATKDHPRRFVMVGSTNNYEYITNPSGIRRFWPIRCGGKIDLDWLAANRGQLLAEAQHRLVAGEVWHDDAGVAAAAQQARVAEDITENEVLGILRDTTLMARINVHIGGHKVLHHFISSQEIVRLLNMRGFVKAGTNAVASIMQRLAAQGWEKHYYDSTVPITLRDPVQVGSTWSVGTRATQKVRGYIHPVPGQIPAQVVVPITQPKF